MKWSTRSLALTTAVKTVAGQVSIRGIIQAEIRNLIKLDVTRKVKMTDLLFLASQVLPFHAQDPQMHLKNKFNKRIYFDSER